MPVTDGPILEKHRVHESETVNSNNQNQRSFKVLARACTASHFSHVRLCDSIDCSPPGSSVLVILQVRILEWVAIPSSRESSQSRDGTQVFCISCIAGRLFTTEPPGKPFSSNKKLIWTLKQSSFFWDETIVIIKRCNSTSYSELLKLLGMFNLKRKTHGWGLLFVNTEARMWSVS